MKKRRSSSHPPNYYRQVEKCPRGDDHPIDVAVRRRVPQQAAQERLRDLQRTVEAQLGSNLKEFIDLEALRNDIGIEREEAYFSVGYEYGFAERAARASPAARSRRAKQLASEVRVLVVQAQLSPEEVMAALLDCLVAALSTFQVASRAGRESAAED